MRVAKEINASELSARDIQRFWANVDQFGPDECWNWTAFCHPSGYGRLMAQGWRHAAHRVAHAIAYGSTPADLLVCHDCDNPKCCNPRHLFIGTDGDNVADMMAKGRGRSGLSAGRGQGELHNMAKLTEAQVYAIEADQRTHAEIALAFGISRSMVGQIKNHKNWRHLWAERCA